jgi:hypothetical protein
MKTDGKTLYTLIPFEDFKAVLGIDDREEKLARFCLVTGIFTIEQYCKRRFMRYPTWAGYQIGKKITKPTRSDNTKLAMSSEQLTMNGEKSKER